MRRILTAAFLLFCAGWYVYRVVVVTFPGAGASDFEWTYQAARHILTGESPYRSQGYIYPPLLAFLLTPLAELDYVSARRVWFAISHVCLLLAGWILWRRLGATSRAACAIAAVWAFGEATEESLGLGQPGALLLLLIVVGLFRGRVQKLAIACGAAVKFIPGVLAFPFVAKRDWRGFGIVAALAAFLVLAPWLVVVGLSGPRNPTHTEFLAGTPALLSWSIPSATLRVLDPPTAAGKLSDSWIYGNQLQFLQLRPRVRAVSLGIALVVLALGLRWLSGRAPNLFFGVALIALALAVAPVCWSHYRILQYAGIAILLERTWSEKRWKLFAITIAAGAFVYMLPVEVLRYTYVRSNGWPAAPAFLYCWTSLPTIADLTIFALSSTFCERRDRQVT